MFSSTSLFLFSKSIRLNRNFQRVIFILSTFVFDFILIMDSMNDAGNLIAPLFLFIGFHCFWFKEMDVKWIVVDLKLFLSPVAIIFIFIIGGLFGVISFGFEPRFASFLCGVLSLGIPVLLLCFWGAGMNTKMLLRHTSIFFLILCLVFAMQHKPPFSLISFVCSVIFFIRSHWISSSECWFGDEFE